MAGWLVVPIFGIAFPLLIFWMIPPLVWHALRTGELEARGRSYFRDQQPKRFWAGIIFWILMMAVALFTSYVVLSMAPERLFR